MTLRSIFPNIITSCNLICGCISVIFAAQSKFTPAFFFILLGAVFDFFDGMMARKLNVSGPLGKEMDSLADEVTFGVAPTMMLFFYLLPAIHLWAVLSLIMAAFTAIRLALFNLDTRQKTEFIGLASPANAIFWASLIAFLPFETVPFFINYCLLGCSFISCFLLISPFHFFSLKFHNCSWHENYCRFIFLIVAAIIVLFCIGLSAVRKDNAYIYLSANLVILWYMVSNIFSNARCKRKP